MSLETPRGGFLQENGQSPCSAGVHVYRGKKAASEQASTPTGQVGQLPPGLEGHGAPLGCWKPQERSKQKSNLFRERGQGRGDQAEVDRALNGVGVWQQGRKKQTD